jgi:hypothetical protein
MRRKNRIKSDKKFNLKGGDLLEVLIKDIPVKVDDPHFQKILNILKDHQINEILPLRFSSLRRGTKNKRRHKVGKKQN